MRSRRSVALLAAAMVWSAGCRKGTSEAPVLPASPTSANDAVVLAQWVPIVRELRARGVIDSVQLVYLLGHYDLTLASGARVWGRFPKAIATVAHVTGENATDLATRCVARAGTAEHAASLLGDLKELEPKLERLPGVIGRGQFGGTTDPRQLAIDIRAFATVNGIALSTTSVSSVEWSGPLKALRRRGFDDPDVLMFVVYRARLRLSSGVVVEPLDEDARYLTVASACGLDPVPFRRDFTHRMLALDPTPLRRAKEARNVLATLEGVWGVEEVATEAR